MKSEKTIKTLRISNNLVENSCIIIEEAPLKSAKIREKRKINIQFHNKIILFNLPSKNSLLKE